MPENNGGEEEKEKEKDRSRFPPQQQPPPLVSSVVSRRERESETYQIIAAEPCEALARRMQLSYPERFAFHKTGWDKFPDGTDRIVIG